MTEKVELKDLVLENKGQASGRYSFNSIDSTLSRRAVKKGSNGCLKSMAFCTVVVLSMLAILVAGASMAVVFFFNLHTSTSNQVKDALSQTESDLTRFNISLQAQFAFYSNTMLRKFNVHRQIYEAQYQEILKLKAKVVSLEKAMNQTIQNFQTNTPAQNISLYDTLNTKIDAHYNTTQSQFNIYNQSHQSHIEDLQTAIQDLGSSLNDTFNTKFDIHDRMIKFQFSNYSQNHQSHIQTAIKHLNYTFNEELDAHSQALQLQLNTSNQNHQSKINDLQTDLKGMGNSLNDSFQTLLETYDLAIQSQLKNYSQVFRTAIQNTATTLNLTFNTNFQMETDKLRSLINTTTELMCESLAPLANGTVSITPGDNLLSHGLGSVATYSCDPGYALMGQTTRTCEDISGGTVTKGTWSGTEPSCSMVMCQPLSEPQNGNIIYSQDGEIAVGVSASYSCHAGYILVGQTTRTCEAVNGEINGTWSGDPPLCKENVTCTQLTQPANGQVTITTGIGGVALGAGTVAMYACENGHDLIGPDTRVCEGSTGTWDGVMPSCVTQIDCRNTTCHHKQLSCFKYEGCRVNCYDSSPYACFNTNINCSTSGECKVDCDDTYACIQSHNTCSEGTCTVDCNHKYSCTSLTMSCSSNTTCTANCGYDSCSWLNFTCPQGGLCDINCGQYSCERATITSPNGSKSSVHCSDYACQYLHSIEQGNTICNGDYSCYGASFVCQQGEGCVECKGYSSCIQSSIKYIGNQSTSLNCTGNYSCNEAEIVCPHNRTCDIHCDGSYSCSGAAFVCEHSDVCAVSCSNEQSCVGATLVCPPGHDCSISCDGLNSCKQATVVCPPEGHSCNVTCTHPLSCQDLIVENTASYSLECRKECLFCF